MFNFLQFLIKTNFTHYSKENYEYFLHLKKLFSNITFEESIIKEKLDVIFIFLYECKLGIKPNNKYIDYEINYLINHLKFDQKFLSQNSNLKYLHLIFQEFYSFNIYNILIVNDFLLKQLYLFEDISKFKNNILNIILSKRNYIEDYLDYTEKFYINKEYFINFTNLLELYEDHTYELIELYSKYIRVQFSIEEFSKLYDFLCKKNNFSNILPSCVFNKIISTTDNMVMTNYFIITMYFVLALDKNSDYSSAKCEILNCFPFLNPTFEEHETRLNIENF